MTPKAESKQGTNTSTTIATYLVVLLAVGVSLYAVHTQRDLVELAAPAVAWSQHQLAAVGEKLPWLRAGTAPQGTSPALHEEFEPAACQLHGTVVDCACSYGAVEKVNRDALWPTLEALVKLPFFRYFKVNLYCDCPLWPDASQCFMRDCCVNECEEHEIPLPWREDDQRKKEQCGGGEAEGGLDRGLGGGIEDRLQAVRNWHGLNNPWVPEPEGDDVEYVYIDLAANPEKYTGYKGEDARRIWGAIYEQSCFEGVDGPDTCKEKQVLYRLISGMHSSITTHVVENFYDEKAGTWGPNMPFFKFKFANPEARQYVENMYFAYLFVLRAVVKAGPALLRTDFNTGFAEEDARTRKLVERLVGSEELRHACPTPFDEAVLWRGEPDRNGELREALREGFHNITSIMDCVGCDKCKMWGKLQVLGIATSLKILFEEEHAGEVELDRNEVIALVNTLGRFSESIETVRRLSLELQRMEAGNGSKTPQFGAIKGLVGSSEGESEGGGDAAPGAAAAS